MGTLNKCLTTNPVSPEDKAALRELTANFVRQGEDAQEAGLLAAQELYGEAQGKHDDVVGQLPEDEKEEPLFQEGKAPQAAIAFPKAGIGEGKTTIAFFEKANLSSFLHETAHFYFEIYRDLASKPDASQAVIDQMDVLVGWMGLESAAQIERKHHEQFADAFETYLQEGKAPSIELQGVFARFRGWLIALYKDLSINNVKLTDEVRQVFDRMLATDEAITAAEEQMVMVAAFDETSSKEVMTDAEYKAYQISIQKASDAAQRDLDLQAQKELARGKLQEWRDELKQVRKEVEEEYGQLPVYRAKEYLMHGRFPTEDLPDGFEPAKLSRNALKEMYGTEKDALWRRLPVGKNTVIGKEGGSHPDDIALLFGYESGDEMIRAMVEAKSFKQAISDEATRRMKAKHGDIMQPEQMAEKAADAVHRDERANYMHVELKAMEKRAGLAVTPRQVLKSAAKRIIAKQKTGSIREYQYIQAEIKYGKEVKRSVADGQYAEAREAQRKRLLNHYLFMEARRAVKEHEKIHRHLTRVGKKGARKSMRGPALEQLYALLARFDLRKSRTQAQVAEIEPLSDWIISESERLTAVMPDIPAWIMDERNRMSYKALTLEQFRELDDAVKQIEFLARREDAMYKERRNLQFSEEKDAILAEIQKAFPEVFDEDGMPIPYRKDMKPILKELGDTIKSKFDGEFVNMENLLDILTNGKGDQVFDSLFERLSEAADEQTTLMRELANFIDPFTKVYSYSERVAFSIFSSRIYIPGVGPKRGEYFTRDRRISVALYAGSPEGRQRLIDGNKYTEDDITTIINTLGARDLEFVKGMWEMNETILWEKLRDLDMRTKGLPPKKVEHIPYQTVHGEMPGGYVPLAYDSDLDTRAYDLGTDDAIKDLRGGGVAATTRQSASKERLEKVNRPLNLSLAAIASKINETVHDITFREAVTDTYRVLQSKRIGDAVRQVMGPSVYNAMLVKVRETAVKPVVPHGVVERGLWYMRRNTLINMMGASFNTVAINILGASPAIRRVGTTRFIRALGKMYGPGAKDRHQWIIDTAPYMRERHNDIDRELSAEQSRFVGKAPLTPRMGTWFLGLSMMDKAITRPLWWAAYEKAMEETKGDKDQSQQIASRVVRQTQGSGRVIDLAKVASGVGPSGEFKRMITMFYNFFSSQLGQMVRSQRLSSHEWTEGKRAKAAMRLTLDTLAIIVIPATLEAIARGQCGDDPDLEDYMYCSARSSAFFTASFFPIIRDAVPYTWKQFDPDAKAFGVKISPIESGLETLARTPGSIADVIRGDASESDIRTIVRGLGYGAGLPGFQASRTIDAYQALIDGDTDNPLTLLTGPQRD